MSLCHSPRCQVTLLGLVTGDKVLLAVDTVPEGHCCDLTTWPGGTEPPVTGGQAWQETAGTECHVSGARGGGNTVQTCSPKSESCGMDTCTPLVMPVCPLGADVGHWCHEEHFQEQGHLGAKGEGGTPWLLHEPPTSHPQCFTKVQGPSSVFEPLNRTHSAEEDQLAGGVDLDQRHPVAPQGLVPRVVYSSGPGSNSGWHGGNQQEQGGGTSFEELRVEEVGDEALVPGVIYTASTGIDSSAYGRGAFGAFPCISSGGSLFSVGWTPLDGPDESGGSSLSKPGLRVRPAEGGWDEVELELGNLVESAGSGIPISSGSRDHLTVKKGRGGMDNETRQVSISDCTVGSRDGLPCRRRCKALSCTAPGLAYSKMRGAFWQPLLTRLRSAASRKRGLNSRK